MMYCRNCGNPMDPGAAVCIHCGVARDTGLSYCPSCGGPAVQDASVCAHCGCALGQTVDPNAKSKLVAGLMGIFLGSLGIHNFYLGFTGKAMAQLLITLISLATLSWISAIWGIVEGILYLTGRKNADADGNPLRG